MPELVVVSIEYLLQLQHIAEVVDSLTEEWAAYNWFPDDQDMIRLLKLVADLDTFPAQMQAFQATEKQQGE